MSGILHRAYWLRNWLQTQNKIQCFWKLFHVLIIAIKPAELVVRNMPLSLKYYCTQSDNWQLNLASHFVSVDKIIGMYIFKRLKENKIYLSILFLTFFYCCSSTVFFLSPPPLPTPPLSPPPSPIYTLLIYFYVFFFSLLFLENTFILKLTLWICILFW